MNARRDTHRWNTKPRTDRQAHAALVEAARLRHAQRQHKRLRPPSAWTRFNRFTRRHLFRLVAVLGALGIVLAIATAEAGPALAIARLIGVHP